MEYEQRWFINADGICVGSYSGPDPLPPWLDGCTQVPFAPPGDNNCRWNAVTQQWDPLPPPPYTLNISTIWGRMTDEEAEAFDAAVSTTPPLRLRKQFQSASTMKSDSELFTWVRNVLIGVSDATRADEILAIELLNQSSEMVELV
jgi:hypothetical protein